MTCQNFRLPSTCPNSPFRLCYQSLGKGSPIALPALHLPCKFCESLEHLNHEREEGGRSLLCCTENIVFLCTIFFRCRGRLFAPPSIFVFHKLSAVLLEQKSAPRRHFKSKWSQISWQEPVTNNRAAFKATVQGCSFNSG